MKKLLIGVTEAALIGLVGVTITQPATAASFNFSDFSDVSGLTLNGSAKQVGNVLQLTQTSGYQAGSAFITNPIALGTNTSFNAHFQFQINNPSGVGGGADGFVFTIQDDPAGPNALGGVGDSLGYAVRGATNGITPSLAVAFDTYSHNDIGVIMNGSETRLASVSPPPINLKSGVPLNAFINYDGTTHVLNTYLSTSTTQPNSPLLSYTVSSSLPANVYVGFTAGTGGGVEEHDIQNFQFSTGVPEPSSTLGILALGAIGAGYTMKRKLNKQKLLKRLFCKNSLPSVS